MSLVFPINRAFKVTPQDHGNIGEFGPASLTDLGTWVFDIVPDASFAGALTVMGRGGGEEASDAGVALVPVPYRAAYLNTAIPVTPYGWASDPITGRSIIHVPAGASIGLMIACTAGFVWVYSRPLIGTAQV